MEITQKKPTLCIYHGNCADGFGAAWVVRKWAAQAEEDIEYFAAQYQTGLPTEHGVDIIDRDIIIVDFSYKYFDMISLAGAAKSVLVLDHHKTAQEELAKPLPGNVHVTFDMNHSGAMLAWQHYFPDVNAPQILLHIEDRDLWRFALPCTRAIQAALFSYEYDFDLWDTLIAHTPVGNLVSEGAAIERKHHKDIRELVSATLRWAEIGGHLVPTANLPYTLSSDAGHLMANEHAPYSFAACWWDTPTGRVFSLRSGDRGLDVSEIAKQYGGGGHQHAAGFKVPLNIPLL